MKRKIGLGLFIIMCFIAWWSITDDFIQDKQTQKTKTVRYIELFMNEFELTTMDETGKPVYHMNGARMERYHGSDVSEVQQPVLLLLQEKNQWIVRADTAKINNQNDTIELEKNVIMLQQNIDPAMTINTQKMLINTRTQIAKSKSAVNITQGKSRIKSVGMIYNNKTSELELTSHVKGEFLPYEYKSTEK